METVGNHECDPRGWSVTIAYFALILNGYIESMDVEGSEEIRCVAVNSIGKTYSLAFDHEAFLSLCPARLRAKVQYTSLLINLLSENFTLSELQNIFEIVLGKSIEKKHSDAKY